MTPGAVRRGLHATHASFSVLLIATGLLLWDPDLRARLIGGYGREILEVHLWLGVGLLSAPVLAGLVTGRALLRDLLRRLGPPDPPFASAKVHIVASLLMTFLLGGSGLLLWADLGLSPRGLDLATGVHVATTWLPGGARRRSHPASPRRKRTRRSRSFDAKIRCELACRYLNDSPAGIGEIAFLLGYSDLSAFEHAFHRWTDCSPGAYRRMARARSRNSADEPAPHSTIARTSVSRPGAPSIRRRSSTPREP